MNIAYTRWGSGPNVVVYTPGIVETRPDGDVSGIAVNIASRVQSTARPGEVLVSDTVRDLMLGSAVGFEDAGTHELKALGRRAAASLRQSDASLIDNRSVNGG